MFNLPQAGEMSRIGLTRILGLVLLFLVILGKADESISFLQTPVNITIESGQNAIFQCIVSSVWSNTSVVLSILTNGFSSNITCPGGPKVVLGPRIQADCNSGDGILGAAWTIKEVTEQDNRTQVLCSAPGLRNVTAFLTVKAVPMTEEVQTSPLIAYVLGGFLGSLLVFALIICGLILYARCKREREDEKHMMANSFSNPSWTGSTDDLGEKSSTSSAARNEPPERSFPEVYPIERLPENMMDICSL